MWLRSFKVLHRVRPRGELTCDVRTHFVAARADRRSDCGDQVGWSRSVELTELLNGLFYYASRRPPPPSMNRRNGLRASIYQQDRYTVGGSDADRLTGLIGHQSVALLFAIGQPRSVPNPVRMDLPECDAGVRITATGPEAVLQPSNLSEAWALVNIIFYNKFQQIY